LGDKKIQALSCATSFFFKEKSRSSIPLRETAITAFAIGRHWNFWTIFPLRRTLGNDTQGMYWAIQFLFQGGIDQTMALQGRPDIVELIRNNHHLKMSFRVYGNIVHV
jgi:hypothetical protein